MSSTAPTNCSQKSRSTARQSISPAGDLVELFFEAGGEIIFDIAGEEAFEERDDDAALVFGNEALLVDAHIAAVLQDLQDGGVGRRPADAEFFHALDQGGFRKARRRLGEMLGGLDRLLA